MITIAIDDSFIIFLIAQGHCSIKILYKALQSVKIFF